MANTPSTSFRFSSKLLRDLDRYAELLTQQTGVPVSRTAAAAKLLSAALAAEGQAPAAEKRGRRRA